MSVEELAAQTAATYLRLKGAPISSSNSSLRSSAEGSAIGGMEGTRNLRAMLEELGQAHLFSKWSGSAADEARFFKQVAQLDSSYPGGLRAYVSNGRQLLADSKSGINPLEGWSPSVPTGTSLRFGSPEYLEHEAVGVRELDGCSFVLVAGGLGERLGFSGIKVELPYQISTGDPYLKFYIRSILALQEQAADITGKRVELPLAIMVSDDTLAGTEKLLKANGYFGMRPSQASANACMAPLMCTPSHWRITMRNQSSVPALHGRYAGDFTETRESSLPGGQRREACS